MKYKLIALDIDDTLLNRKKKITPKTKEALIKAQEKGVKVVITSGRMPYSVRKYAEELHALENDGYYIGFNGGAIVNAKGEIIDEIFLEKQQIDMVYKALEPYNVTTIVHKDTCLYADKKVNKYTDVNAEVMGVPQYLVDNIAQFVDWNIHKLLLAGEPEELKALEKILIKQFGGVLDIYLSAPWFLEIMPMGINKGIGVKALATHLGITMNEVIACGDNYNDFSMVEMAGLGVAMSNAVDELKSVANYVTENDCDNDGIAEVVEKFILTV